MCNYQDQVKQEFLPAGALLPGARGDAPVRAESGPYDHAAVPEGGLQFDDYVQHRVRPQYGVYARRVV